MFNLKPINFGPKTQGDPVPRPVALGHSANRRFAALALAAEVLGALPGPGESLHAVMCGRYDLTDVLEVLFAKLGRVKRLRIATLSFNMHNVTLIEDWLKAGAVQSLTLLYSLFFKEHSPEIVQALGQALEGTEHRTAASRNHCKVVTFDFHSGRKLSLEGSANLRTNSNREQFCLVDGPQLHDWHAAWIDEQVARHEVHKSRNAETG